MPIRCQSVEQEDETINNLGVDSCFLESCRKNFRCIPLQITSARQSLLLFCLLIQQGDQKSFLIETKDKVAEKKLPKVTSSEVAPTEVTTPNAAKPKRR